MPLLRIVLFVGLALVAMVIGLGTSLQRAYLREDHEVRADLLAAVRDGRPSAPGHELRFYADFFTPADIAREPSIATAVTREQLRQALRSAPYQIEEMSLRDRVWQGFTYGH